MLHFVFLTYETFVTENFHFLLHTHSPRHDWVPIRSLTLRKYTCTYVFTLFSSSLQFFRIPSTSLFLFWGMKFRHEDQSKKTSLRLRSRVRGVSLGLSRMKDGQTCESPYSRNREIGITLYPRTLPPVSSCRVSVPEVARQKLPLSREYVTCSVGLESSSVDKCPSVWHWSP